ncbi:MAG: ThiF family adenylyltransferase [Dehalococcoidia bacterium]
MSQRQIARSDDLRRLRDAGYGLRIVGGALVVHPVPFLDAKGQVGVGSLVCDLDLIGDRTTKPRSHVAYFAGGTPHDTAGRRLAAIINSDSVQQKGGLTTSHLLSSKPSRSGYADYFTKVTTYATAISSHAEAVDPDATPQCFPPVPSDDDEDPFLYIDTASSRAGVDTSAFHPLAIGIVGLGGTGVYVLDLVTKTPVRAIGCYDGDVLLQHNAFRSPGAVTLEDLETAPNKAEHWVSQYRRFRRGLSAHPYRIDEANVAELHQYDFVFVCVDDNEARRLIAASLTEAAIPCIDTGMGLYRTDASQLGGIVRTTTATPTYHSHLNDRLPRGTDDDDDEYRTNIQIAELNALNATLAVIKWKKLVGFYADQDQEHESGYMLASNCIVNEDSP